MNMGTGRDLAAVGEPSRQVDLSSLPSGTVHDAHFAVVVGINRYPGLADLAGPLDDAANFVDWLVSPTGGAVPSANVFEVPAARELSPGLAVHDARPSVPDIVNALRNVNLAVDALAATDPSSWWRSRLYLFVAGHGMVPDGSDSGALFTANASAAELGHNINLLLYKIWYQQCGRFRDLVIFADCCRTLMPAAPSFGPPFSRCVGTPGEVRTVMGYGTQFGAQAFESPTVDGTRGQFTMALLRGLRRTGTRQHPSLRWGDLKGIVRDALRDLDPAGRQRAECIGDEDVELGPPVAAAVRPDDRSAVTIWMSSAAYGPVDLLDGRLEVIGSWDGSGGQWHLALPAGLYQLVHADTRAEIRGFTVMGVDVDVRL
jgi:hypothetical protein